MWYENLSSTTPIFIGNVYTTPELFTNTRYYLEARINGCFSANRTPLDIVVDNQEPDFEIPTEVVLCKNEGGVDVSVISSLASYQYTWENETGDIVATGSTARLTEPGNYFVTATANSGCISNPEEIKVSASEISTISAKNIIVEGFGTNNRVLFKVQDIGIGDYEFSLDNPKGPFTQQTLYENLQPGIHILYIKDRLGCGIQSYRFAVLNYPLFFTPNEDNTNEIWSFSGFDRTFYTKVEIQIFNRFGLLIATLDQFSVGWNGFYGGKKMPSDDYWFLAKLTDINGLTIERSGHFSLIRPN